MYEKNENGYSTYQQSNGMSNYGGNGYTENNYNGGNGGNSFNEQYIPPQNDSEEQLSLILFVIVSTF
jgi:hypothetical protein